MRPICTKANDVLYATRCLKCLNNRLEDINYFSSVCWLIWNLPLRMSLSCLVSSSEERGSYFTGSPLLSLPLPVKPLGSGSLVFWDEYVSSSYCFASLPQHLMGPIKVINRTVVGPVSSLQNILQRDWACEGWIQSCANLHSQRINLIRLITPQHVWNRVCLYWEGRRV